MRTPGLHILPPAPPARIDASRIDVPAFIGVAERGTIGQSVALSGWPAYREVFGGYLPNAHLAYAVFAFFENGGARCHVTRVAAPAAETQSNPLQPLSDNGITAAVVSSAGFVAGAAVHAAQQIETASVGPQPADRASSIVASTAGLQAGTMVRVRQGDLTRLWRVLSRVEDAASAITFREPLTLDYDLTQPIQFTVTRTATRLMATAGGNVLTFTRPLPGNIVRNRQIDYRSGRGTAGGELPSERGVPLLRIQASSPGAWGNALVVRLARGSAAETETRTRPAPLPPDAPNLLSLARIQGLPVGATLTLQQEGAAPVRRRVAGVLGPERQIRLDADLPGTFSMAQAASGFRPVRLRRETFTLSVVERDRLVELHSDLDLPEAGILPLIAGSRIIAERLAIASEPYPLPHPEQLATSGALRLDGGLDGIAALLPDDFLAGLAPYDDEDEPAAIAMPDIQPPVVAASETLPSPPVVPDPCALDPSAAVPIPDKLSTIVEAAPVISAGAHAALARALVAHCEGRGDRIAVLDAPRDLDAADPFDPESAIDWALGQANSYAALYWPWVLAVDPLDRLGGLRTIPPSGHVLGAWARSDVAHGTQKAPANQPLLFVEALSRETDTARLGLLNAGGVNAIRPFTGAGVRIYGARTLSPQPDLALLNVRRILIQLRRSLRQSLQWVVFEPDNAALRRRLQTAVEGFLERWWRAGRFAGATADQAFLVHIALPEALGPGTLLVEIAVAPVRPAEFVVLTVTRTDEAISIGEPAVSAGVAQGGAA